MTNVLCFGTSLTSGYLDGGLNHWPYALALQKECSEFHVTVSGHDGGTCIHTLEEISLSVEFRKILDSLEWDEVIVLVGTNDIARGHTAEEIFTAWKPCLDYAHYVKDVNLWVVGLPLKCNSEKSIRRHFNQLLDNWCEQRDQAYVPFPDELLEHLWDTDRIHLTRQGSNMLGCYLGNLIKTEINNV